MSAEAPTHWHAAVDLGASGGRVAIGRVADRRLELEVVHRFPNGPVMVPRPHGSGLYWDVLGLWRETLHGMKLAGERVEHLSGRVVSVGVDSWAVDYALLDRNDLLLDGVHHYRSPRTNGVMDDVLTRVPKDTLYDLTGIQFLPFNTLYQLLALRGEAPDVLERAARFLMVPDLLHAWLCGRQVGEHTNASTTQCYDPRTRTWSKAVLDIFNLPQEVLPDLVEPGTVLAPLLPSVVQATGLDGAWVVVPATHDTASAVAAVPFTGPGAAYISSGTWSLVGVETSAPVITPEALRANFTNEAGVQGTNRLLKNVMGLWIVQECRHAWDHPSFANLSAEAEEALPFLTVIDPDDPLFLAPGPSMPDRVRRWCRASGQQVPETRGQIVRAVLESLALKYAGVLDELEAITGTPIHTVQVVGGGSQARPLCQWTANATGRRVLAGPVDATLIGNLLVQAEGWERLAPGERREVVARSFETHEYLPQERQAWREARERFDQVRSVGVLS